jgi:pimeloyl-ACP methyl ester carboxylesterase
MIKVYKAPVSAKGVAPIVAYPSLLRSRCPLFTMEGDANGAPRPEPSPYRKKFTGRYEHRTIKGGIGHNLPQEAPQAFAEAVVDVAQV